LKNTLEAKVMLKCRWFEGGILWAGTAQEDLKNPSLSSVLINLIKS